MNNLDKYAYSALTAKKKPKTISTIANDSPSAIKEKQIKEKVIVEYEEESKDHSNLNLTVRERKVVQNKTDGRIPLGLSVMKAPADWKLMWDGIEKMTSEIEAPVDQVRKDEKKELTDDNRYRILISLMLSSRTTDKITDATLKYLVDEKSLSVETVLNTPEATLATWIEKVNFHNTKAKHIKLAT